MALKALERLVTGRPNFENYGPRNMLAGELRDKQNTWGDWIEAGRDFNRQNPTSSVMEFVVTGWMGRRKYLELDFSEDRLWLRGREFDGEDTRMWWMGVNENGAALVSRNKFIGAGFVQEFEIDRKVNPSECVLMADMYQWPSGITGVNVLGVLSGLIEGGVEGRKEDEVGLVEQWFEETFPGFSMTESRGLTVMSSDEVDGLGVPVGIEVRKGEWVIEFTDGESVSRLPIGDGKDPRLSNISGLKELMAAVNE